MAFAALETYVEDRVIEAVNAIAGINSEGNRLAAFYKYGLEDDLGSSTRPVKTGCEPCSKDRWASMPLMAGCGTIMMPLGLAAI